MTSELKTVFSRPALRHLAGPRSFDRGFQYARDQRTRKLRADDEEATAMVRGTTDYRVRLWVKGGEPGFECTCPMGEAGEFCKHCVAVGLALGEDVPKPSSTPVPTTADIRTYLRSQDKDDLVELLVERAEDELLRGRLELEAAKESGGEANLEAYRRAIDETIVVHDFVGYREMYDYSQDISEVIRSIRELLGTGHANEVVVLCEYALEALEDAWGRVDDSDGSMGWNRDELVDLHHEACFHARPDPAALAKRLFDWELHSEWETFLGAAAEYDTVLGSEGMTTYRDLAEEAWAGVPARSASDERDFSNFRWRITHIMETLARMTGSVDEVVAVKSRDLSSPYSYLQIAQVLLEADRHDEALDWAERGLAAFGEKIDTRLRAFIADEYHRRERHDEAMALVWAMFSERPNVGAYERLHHHAILAGTWDEWREQALDRLRADAAAAKDDKTPRSPWAKPADHSTLVEVFLWENEVEAAWAEAQTGGCSHDLWLRLATTREADHPADVIPIYQDHVERTIQVKKNDAYTEAVEWMHRIEHLLGDLGRRDEFPAYAAEVRARHRPKRNLMKLFDSAGW